MVICRQKFIDYGIAFEIKSDTTLKTKGSEVQFSQVLINLFNNAVETKLENNLILYFTDSGTGIAAEIEDKIMHPFFTTKEPGKGTGLGLSISRSIIEKAGGKFYYDRTSRQTRFVIEMPLV